MKLECIHWLDHFSYQQSWIDKETIDSNDGGLKVVTTGWVIKEDKDTVHLCATMAESGKVGNHMGIMKKLILRRWVIKDPSAKVRAGLTSKN